MFDKRVILLLLIGLNAFSQVPGNGVTDIDGNAYSTVIIGTQEWTSENLAVTKFRNGDPIPETSDDILWTMSDDSWCYYQNNPSNDLVYGKLYQWGVVSDPRGLAPEGWHIPDIVEWNTLVTALGGAATAGGEMKSTSLWSSPNTGATNNSGFNGLPASFRHSYGGFGNPLGQAGLWWSTHPSNPDTSFFIVLSHDSNAVTTYVGPPAGYSVRLVKDKELYIQSNESDGIKIYPNPTNDEIVIAVANTLNLIYNVEIINLVGQTIVYQSFVNCNIISLKRFGSGVYFVKVSDSSNMIITTQKIIVR